MFRRVVKAFSSPWRIKSRPFMLLFLFLNAGCVAQDSNENTVAPPKKAVKNSVLGEKRPIFETICPGGERPVGLALFFSIPCAENAECSFLGKEQKCCSGFCRKGVPAPPKEPKHEALLGVARMCPKEPVLEFLPVKPCSEDRDCEEGRRVCCPDAKDFKLYCRTAAPVWSQLPFQRVHAPLKSLIEYMQCQEPVPSILNLFPQPCNRTVDCFPNLCCQEGSGKFCRPPKKSVVALLAQATQRIARIRIE